MWGQRQDFVLILDACISHRKSPKFSQGVGQGLTCPDFFCISPKLLGPGIKAQNLCFSLQSVFPAGSSRLKMDRGILGPLSHGRAPSLSLPLNIPTDLQHLAKCPRKPIGWHRDPQFHGQRDTGGDVPRGALWFSGGHQAWGGRTESQKQCGCSA